VAASETVGEKAVGNVLGILVGGLIFVAANTLQKRFMNKRRSAG
jgi:hypothetical protein